MNTRLTRTLDVLTRVRFSAMDMIWMSASANLAIQRHFVLALTVMTLGAFISVMAEKIHRNRVRLAMIHKAEEFDRRWKDMVDTNQIAAAVAEYRRCYGSTLYEAKTKVFAYADRK